MDIVSHVKAGFFRKIGETEEHVKYPNSTLEKWFDLLNEYVASGVLAHLEWAPADHESSLCEDDDREEARSIGANFAVGLVNEWLHTPEGEDWNTRQASAYMEEKELNELKVQQRVIANWTI